MQVCNYYHSRDELTLYDNAYDHLAGEPEPERTIGVQVESAGPAMVCVITDYALPYGEAAFGIELTDVQYGACITLLEEYASQESIDCGDYD